MRKYKLPLLLGLLLAGIISVWLLPAILRALPTRYACLLYTSDAADERSSVDLGGRRIIKKKKNQANVNIPDMSTLTTTTPPHRGLYKTQ